MGGLLGPSEQRSVLGSWDLPEQVRQREARVCTSSQDLTQAFDGHTSRLERDAVDPFSCE